MNDALMRAPLVAVVLACFAFTGDADAQSVDLGGRVYMDYFYQLSSPESEQEGLHGFTYRRLYLTTNFSWSDEIRGRARLEANEGTTGGKGPVPYVKDLWIEWTYAGDHAATIGVQPPPVFDIAEGVYGYRSLEKTVLDFQDINSSRDFGIRLDGPLTADGSVRYAAMLANSAGAKPETDVYKRGYVELSFFPTDVLSFSVNADQAGYGDDRDRSRRVTAFGGYQADGFSLGAQAYWYELEYAFGDPFRNVGLSVFGTFRLNERWELTARTDISREGPEIDEIDETFLLAGVTYSPTDGVRIIPNIWFFDSESLIDPDALGRLTVEVNF